MKGWTIPEAAAAFDEAHRLDEAAMRRVQELIDDQILNARQVRFEHLDAEARLGNHVRCLMDQHSGLLEAAGVTVPSTT